MRREACEFRQPGIHDEAVIRKAHGGKRHAVGRIGHGSYALSEHVDHPIGGLALGDERVQRPGRGPHDVAARLVILVVFRGDATALDHAAHKAFGDAVAHVVVGAAEILLANMVERVVDAGHNLPMRQAQSEFGVENREFGHHVAVRENVSHLKLGGMVGNHCARVHFRARAGHGEHASHGNNRAAWLLQANEVFLPRVLVSVH